MGKSSVNAPFSIAMLNNQMVFLICLHHLYMVKVDGSGSVAPAGYV